MSVYVDKSQLHFRGQLYCHMIADTENELDAMAQRIGLQRAWKQPPTRGTTMPHYDLSPSKRVRAVQAGAIEVTGRELALKMFPHIAQRLATGEALRRPGMEASG